MTPAERRLADLEARADNAERNAALVARIEADREARAEAEAAAFVEGLDENERMELAFVVLTRLPVYLYAALADNATVDEEGSVHIAFAMAHHAPLLHGMTLVAGFETLADVATLRDAQVIEHRDTAERAGVAPEGMPMFVAMATCDRTSLDEILEVAGAAARRLAHDPPVE